MRPIIREFMNRLKIKPVVQEWIESIVIAFVLAMFIRTFFFQAFRIPSGSMKPTLTEGDRLLVNKLQYGPRIPFTQKRLPGFSQPQRGDVVVFIYPKDRKKDFIKRLIAFGGETVQIKNGKIFVNDQWIDAPGIKKNIYYNNDAPFGREGQVIAVPPGYLFVLGDNSASSSDSRVWGFVPEVDVIGKAEIIYWPLNRIRFIR